MSRKNDTERTEANASLRKMLKPGAIDLAIPVREYRDVYPRGADGRTDYDAKPRKVFAGLRVRNIGWLAAKAMDDKFDRDHSGIKVGGCGMDMGFSLVYNLGATLWPKGTRKPHGTRNGEPDTAGGYALKHEWL